MCFYLPQQYLREGNVFTGVCQSVILFTRGSGHLWSHILSRGMGISGTKSLLGVSLGVSMCSGCVPTSPPDRGPGDTVRKRTVRILLECFLVSCIIIKLYFFLRISCRREVDVDEVLSPYQKCHNPRRILLEGASGTGKSLLSHYLAYGWATRKITSLERYCATL